VELVEQFTAADAEGLPHIVCAYRDAAECTILSRCLKPDVTERLRCLT